MALQENKDVIICKLFSSLQQLADLRRQYDRVVSEVNGKPDTVLHIYYIRVILTCPKHVTLHQVV